MENHIVTGKKEALIVNKYGAVKMSMYLYEDALMKIRDEFGYDEIGDELVDAFLQAETIKHCYNHSISFKNFLYCKVNLFHFINPNSNITETLFYQPKSYRNDIAVEGKDFYYYLLEEKEITHFIAISNQTVLTGQLPTLGVNRFKEVFFEDVELLVNEFTVELHYKEFLNELKTKYSQVINITGEKHKLNVYKDKSITYEYFNPYGMTFLCIF